MPRFGTPQGLSQGKRNFVLGARSRSWSVIQQKLGEHARSVAFDLVRCGAIYLKCSVTEDLGLGRPTGWYLTEAGTASTAQRSAAANSARADLDRRRRSVLARLITLADASSDQGTDAAEVSRDAVETLAAALEGATGPATLPVLIAATEDLLDGIKHGSPRDFSLAHFTHSKERDDAAYLLASAGVPDEIAAGLGIRRPPRLGVAGAIDAIVARQTVPLSLLDGPVGAENLCHQAIFMNHASGAVAPPDAEVVQVGDAIWQRAKRRGLLQVRCGRCVL